MCQCWRKFVDGGLLGKCVKFTANEQLFCFIDSFSTAGMGQKAYPSGASREGVPKEGYDNFCDTNIQNFCEL